MDYQLTYLAAIQDGHLITAMGILAGVIAVLWKINVTNSKSIEKRADRLEEKHDENHIKLLEMSDQLGELRGRVTIAEEIFPHLNRLTESIEELSINVVKAVSREN